MGKWLVIMLSFMCSKQTRSKLERRHAEEEKGTTRIRGIHLLLAQLSRSSDEAKGSRILTRNRDRGLYLEILPIGRYPTRREGSRITTPLDPKMRVDSLLQISSPFNLELAKSDTRDHGMQIHPLHSGTSRRPQNQCDWYGSGH